MKAWLLALAVTLVPGVTVLAQEAAPRKDAGKPAESATAELKVPAGVKGAEGTTAEPYTLTGWAKEIMHEKTGMVLVYVPAGHFTMGSPGDEAGRKDEETQHRVRLTQGFYLGKYEVTQGQWEKVMGNNPSFFKKAGKDAPVEMVSWDDCQAFVAKLSADGGEFRLPTEAEWEYACRAGTKPALNNGKDLTPTTGRCRNLDEVGWYDDNSGNTTHPVGQKKPNAWDLYDMHGNVGEWCNDFYGEYPAGEVTDPVGPTAARGHVARGGSWHGTAGGCRSACRGGLLTPTVRRDARGLRVVLSLPRPEAK